MKNQSIGPVVLCRENAQAGAVASLKLSFRLGCLGGLRWLQATDDRFMQGLAKRGFLQSPIDDQLGRGFAEHRRVRCEHQDR